MQKTLRITGRGKVKATPDIMIISFDAAGHEWEYQDAIDLLNQKVKTLRDIIESVGLDKTDLKTKNFRIDKSTTYNKEKEKYEFNGFRAEHDLEIEVPLDNKLVNTLIMKLASITEVEFKISFGIKDPDKLKEPLIQSAIEQAKHSAGIITKASGVKLGNIVDINYSFDELFVRSSSIDYDTNYALSDNESAMPDLEPDDIKLTETINITWELQ